MTKLIDKIKRLNKIYESSKENFDIIKKMFHNNSFIKQKLTLIEQLLDDVYIKIMNVLETKETNDKFYKIMKGIKNEHKKNR